MKRLVDVTNDEAKKHFLKGSSYFNQDLPDYINFEPILKSVADVLGKKSYIDFQKEDPARFSGVNYNFVANKDGRFDWRPHELMHPAIYVSLVNLICEPKNWSHITERLKQFQAGSVDCCSSPVVSMSTQSDQAT